MEDVSHLVSNALWQIFQKTPREIEDEFSALFYQDHKRLRYRTNIEQYRLISKHIFDVTHAAGKRVIDLGCGVGLLSIYMASFGVRELIAVDHMEEDINVLNKLLSYLDPPLTNIVGAVHDVLRLPYPDGSFDVVTCHDAISHLRDVDRALSEMTRVLKAGGVLYLQDGNNSLAILGRRPRRKHWKMIEYGPIPIHIHGLRRVSGLPSYTNEEELPYVQRERLWKAKASTLPYFYMRREMIRFKYPALDTKTLDLLAKETAGMVGEQIVNAVDEYLKEGQVKTRVPYICRNPAMGEPNEAEFNPFALRKRIADSGYSASLIRPYYAPQLSLSEKRPSFRELVKYVGAHVLPIFYPASVFICPTFEILANKR